MRNLLAEALCSGRFCWLLEYVAAVDRQLPDTQAIAEVLDRAFAGFTVTDRVTSATDPAVFPLAYELGRRNATQPLPHFSGKGRELDDLRRLVDEMAAAGLCNLLLLSGDRLADDGRDTRIRYLESVPALAAVRTWRPDWCLGVALNPFKYREEERGAQYLKLAKKIRAGADFAITQLGFDPDGHAQAVDWMRARQDAIPLLACVMPLTAARLRAMRRKALPGVVLSDSLLELLEHDERSADAGRCRASRRLALQIVRLRQLGYAGIQLTGVHEPDELKALQAYVDEYQRSCSDEQQWRVAWEKLMRLPDGRIADPRPVSAARALAVQPSIGERWRFQLLELAHQQLFGSGWLARGVSVVVRGIGEQPWLGRLEHAIKNPLVGCETCGSCRLAETQYICPETCPKGLANGPCGGTQDNCCEFGDRECIHSVRYRLAAEHGQLQQWEDHLIPAISLDERYRSSWPEWFTRGSCVKELPANRKTYRCRPK